MKPMDDVSLSETARLTPRQIIDNAMRYQPVAFYVGFSGGNDSVVVAHWMMANVPGCKVVHVSTGIGVKQTFDHVVAVCERYGWPLVVVRSKEDCGQDYDALVLERGFPGPDMHKKMYDRLKGRAVALLVKRAKVGHDRTAKVLIASGIRHDESLIRMGYAGREINYIGGQLWANPIYWFTKADRDAYIAHHGLPRNPVSDKIGISGECLCGAYAQRGELDLVRKVDPEVAARIDRLQAQCLERGFTWGWEGHPPKGGFNPDQGTFFHPLCGTCEKSAIVQTELESA